MLDNFLEWLLTKEDFVAWFLSDKFWKACLIYLLIITPIEMLIHELGHYYFQIKYKIQVVLFKIGIFNLIEWQSAGGTKFVLGIPFLKAESRCLGETTDKEKTKNNPRSFYYVNRHPKERFITALAGPMAALIPAFLILAIYSLLNGESLTVYFLLLVVIVGELMNLIVPFKLPWKGGALSSDAWIAITSLWQWWKWKAKKQ